MEKKGQMIETLTKRYNELKRRIDYCNESRERGNKDWEYQAHRMMENAVKDFMTDLNDTINYLKEN